MEILQKTLTSFEFVADSPIDILYPDIMAIAPNVVGIISLRDPSSWAKKRLTSHFTGF